MAVAALGPLIAIAFISVLILALSGYKATLGRVVQWLIANIPVISIGALGVTVTSDLFGFIRVPLETFDNAVYAWLGGLLEAQQWLWNQFLHWNAYAWDKVSGAVEEVAVSAEQAIERVGKATVPRLVGASTGFLIPIVYNQRSQVAALWTHLAAVAARDTATVIHEVRPTTVRVEKLTSTVYRDVPVAVSKAVALPVPQLGRLEHDFSETWDRLKSVGKTLTPAGVAGLVGSAVFARFGLGWLRCSNVNKVGNKLCGLNTNLLEDLLGGLVAIFGTLSLVSLAEQYQKLLPDVAGEVRHFWRADVDTTTRNPGLGETGL